MMNLFTTAALLAMALGDPGFVALPVKRHEVKTNQTSTLSTKNKIQAAVPESLQNKVVQYLVEFELGSPGQKQIASIDTGSSDLWVFGPNTGAPTTYDPSKSSDNKYVNNGFEIEYVDGTTSSGNYYTDLITWGSTQIDFQFAVTTQQYQNTNGVFGIASEASEASQDGEYPNFPVALKQQGKIDSVAYSLYLDDINASSGTLLFGAVDTSQYTGPIKAVPITSSSRFAVDVEVAGQQISGILDAGTSLTYLPDSIVSEIANQVGAYQDFLSGMYMSESDTPSGSVTYSFGGLEVTVPTSELFIELNGPGNGWYLTILSNDQSQGFNLLGDSFLRSAYVVYDLSNNQIAIAQADNSPSESHYVPITSAGIPGTY